MQIKKAEYISSHTNYLKCPTPNKPEFALIGRSNVGKSSLINCLTQRSKLAKTSQKPGKTQTINHYLINDNWYLVDLPGYGWAQTSKQNRFQWGQMLRDYFIQRSNLLGVFVLIDARIKAQEIDLDFMRFLGESQVPFVMLFTKTDKLTPNKLASSLAEYEKVMLEEWEEMPMYFVTSAITGAGMEDILRFIHKINQEAKLS
ncbi:MAG: ribosome biogenesis GTP-binding protein YihA/YsxC [Microscillaceae bacterium]|nr:ribosome biogenesis GTP-binding protein YihA/YsxC [Microscillaceae bacterium]